MHILRINLADRLVSVLIVFETQTRGAGQITATKTFKRLSFCSSPITLGARLRISLQMMSNHNLQEVDSLEILNIIDNEIDLFSESPGLIREFSLHLSSGTMKHDPETGEKVFDWEDCCCAVNGLSLLLTARRGDKKSTILFDTGPQPSTFTLNSRKLRVPFQDISTIVLSHWHSDHSGALEPAIKLCTESRKLHGITNKVIVDLHPDRPLKRGAGILGSPKFFQLQVDPTFEQLEAAGGDIRKHNQSHTVADNFFFVSGEIPRLTEFEEGLPFQYRWIDGKWVHEPHVMDERWVAVKVKGKGIILFTGCSHAGIVNVVADASKKIGGPIYMVMGGLHLAGKLNETRIGPTVEELDKYNINFIVGGHCTGWHAKVAIEQKMPGKFVPCGAGAMIVVNSDEIEEAKSNEKS